MDIFADHDIHNFQSSYEGQSLVCVLAAEVVSSLFQHAMTVHSHDGHLSLGLAGSTNSDMLRNSRMQGF